MTRPSPEFTHENLLRELAPQVLGAVIRRFGDFGAAEDAVQEALLAATLQWPKEGLPDNPRGWLIQVAARRVTDHLRSESARRRRETVAATDPLRHRRFGNEKRSGDLRGRQTTNCAERQRDG